MAQVSPETMIELLQAVNKTQSAQIDEQTKTIKDLRELVVQLRGIIANLEETVREFQRKLFGSSSEVLPSEEEETEEDNEQEILFPPFLPLKIEELALTKGEKKMIKDMHNNPPVGKYLIQPGSFPDYREIIKSSKEELYQRILQGKEEASLCLEKMNAGDWCSDYRSYENWKKDFQDYLKLLYSDLWYENGDIKED